MPPGKNLKITPLPSHSLEQSRNSSHLDKAFFKFGEEKCHPGGYFPLIKMQLATLEEKGGVPGGT